MSNHPGYPDRRVPQNRQPTNNQVYATGQAGQQPPNQNDAQRNPPVHMPTGQYQRPNQFPGGFNIARPFQPPATNAGQAYQNNQNPNQPILQAINTQPQYNNNRASVMISPGTYSTPYQPFPTTQYNNQNSSYCNMTQPILSPMDLLRKFYGTCHGCKQPNTDFAACQACNQWLANMEAAVNERKALLQRQFCELCKLPKHVHHQIAACGKCGFPKSNIEELSKAAIKKESTDSIFEDLKLKEQLGFVCTNCNHNLEGFLKCPTYSEVATRMRKERELVQFEDPNFQKLSNIVKDYAEKERKMKPQIQKSTKPNQSTKNSDDKVNVLIEKTKELHIDPNNQNVYHQGNYNYGAYPKQNNQGSYGGPPNAYPPFK